ncbi:hypothetical protein DLAC_01307 [Tieghemostelium lacteum]|uniref:Ubiquitin-like domain-containing protein n=1 Tax=Tieghemostelium lacteum TaxID=361077 RepID=A0A152A8C6_TIELA|nr:hypothetical protein DLAC_01307 [Tieghemostelium lacteum]|eukprot:KYR02466.1 hypothetical protein DLAC_01307 [Tieghemostelium lacteum]
MDPNEIKDIKLYIQTDCKYYSDLTVKNNITFDSFMENHIKPLLVSRGFKELDYVPFKDDTRILDTHKTLQELSIIDNDHLNFLPNRYNLSGLEPTSHVFIKLHNDNQEPIKIDCAVGHTVNYIIKKFSEITQIPTNNIRLVFAGKILDPYRTLSNSAIQKGTTITCFNPNAVTTNSQ